MSCRGVDGPCCPSCFKSRYSDVSSSPAPTLEGTASLGEERLDRSERGDCAKLNAETFSQAALLAVAESSGLQTQGALRGSRPQQQC
ncbi:Prickle-Like Protein 4 [Manis pentadactyla]|nr:Prickle-Like Protein 4 [Manis pentadactyla]